MKRLIYLDNAATTRVHPDTLDEMRPFFIDSYANPSSSHPLGHKARAAVDDARETVASALGCEPAELVFTGSGTEADNLALLGAALGNQAKGRHIITTAIEHQAILSAAETLEALGFEVTRLPVDRFCRVRLDALEAALRPDTTLVSVMLANNETGSVQPVEEIRSLLKPRGILLHTDAVQAFGKMPIKVEDLGVDLLSISAHKIHGPKGVGGLYIRSGVRVQRLMHGGHQENGRRAGTENVPGIVGFASAVRRAIAWVPNDLRRIRELRDRLETGLLRQLETVRVNAGGGLRIPTIASISFPKINGNYLLNQLHAKEICVTAGSACSSAHQEPSHVLRAMGLSAADAQRSIRFSLSTETTEADVDEAVERIVGIVHRIAFTKSPIPGTTTQSAV